MELRPPLHLGVVAIEKGTFGSPLTKVANFTYLLFYIQFPVEFWITWILKKENPKIESFPPSADLDLGYIYIYIYIYIFQRLVWK